MKKIINLNSDSDKARQGVSVNSFRSYVDRSALTNTLMEITYAPSGVIAAKYSSATGGTAAFIRYTTYAQCLPNLASCATFKNNIDVGYSFGGALRIVE